MQRRNEPPQDFSSLDVEILTGQGEQVITNVSKGYTWGAMPPFLLSSIFIWKSSMSRRAKPKPDKFYSERSDVVATGIVTSKHRAGNGEQDAFA